MSVLIISPGDNVGIVLRDMNAGEELLIGGKKLIAAEDIPYTHKIAVTDIPVGSSVIKYGEIIATSSRDIRRGEWVHVHNLAVDKDE